VAKFWVLGVPVNGGADRQPDRDARGGDTGRYLHPPRNGLLMKHSGPNASAIARPMDKLRNRLVVEDSREADQPDIVRPDDDPDDHLRYFRDRSDP
jgi:hypothetical protein